MAAPSYDPTDNVQLVQCLRIPVGTFCPLCEPVGLPVPMSKIRTTDAQRGEHRRGDQEKAGFEPTWVTVHPCPHCTQGNSLLWFDEMLKTVPPASLASLATLTQRRVPHSLGVEA